LPPFRHEDDVVAVEEPREPEQTVARRDALQPAPRAVALVDHLQHFFELLFAVRAAVLAHEVREAARARQAPQDFEDAVRPLRAVARHDVEMRGGLVEHELLQARADGLTREV